MFERRSDEADALVTVNRTNDNQKIYVPGKYLDARKIYTLNNSSKNDLSPHGGLVLKKTRK